MSSIKFPVGATHARQQNSDGGWFVVNTKGTMFLKASHPVEFGTFSAGVFNILPPVAAPAATVAAHVVAPVAAPVAPVPANGRRTKTQLIEHLLLTTALNAAEIAQKVIAEFGGELAPTLKTISAVPTRLRARGIACRRFSNRQPVRRAVTIIPEDDYRNAPETPAHLA